MADYKIEKDIIEGLPDKELTASKIVVAHEAGNPNNTGEDSLDIEVKYMKDNHDSAFVSDFVGGGGKIIQLAKPGKFQYGAGPKANPVAYAHVEMARTDDKDTFKEDYKAWVWTLRKRADHAGIPKTFDSDDDKGIKSHKWVSDNLGGSDHTDPFAYFSEFGISEKQVKKDIENGIDEDPEPTEKKDPDKSKKNNVLKWEDAGSSWDGKNLKKGDEGGAVKELQTMLAEHDPPFYPNIQEKNNGIDSRFGGDTQNAVERFQTIKGLDVDGIAGKDTYKSLGGKKSSKKKSNDEDVIKSIQRWVGTEADGYDGPNTQKALIKKYQKELNSQFDAGLDVDGLWGPASKKATVNVTKGANGNITKVLQSALYLAGYKKDGKPDGDFGKNTKANVKNFQKDKGLNQDGIVGKGTFSELFD